MYAPNVVQTDSRNNIIKVVGGRDCWEFAEETEGNEENGKVGVWRVPDFGGRFSLYLEKEKMSS